MVGSVILLSVYFGIIGIIGGFFVTRLHSAIPFEEFIYQLSRVLSLNDLFLMFCKNILCSFFIAGICTFRALQCKVSMTEVPQQNIKAVTHCVFVVLFINFVFVAGEFLNSNIMGLARYAGY